MAEKKRDSPPKPKESYPLFSLSNHYHQLGLGFGSGSGLFASPDKPLSPSPPPVEVLSSEESCPKTSHPEPVFINEEVTLLKGRVSTFDVFGVANSDLVPGKYEGGLKLWEGSLDLVRTLWTEIQQGQLSIIGKRVLELGCGHGLPGIFTCIEGASAIHFQDFNSEVLKCLTIPNVKVNLDSFKKKNSNVTDIKTSQSPEIRFFAGDWSNMHDLLFQKCDHDGTEKDSGMNSTRGIYDGYDIVLMAETVYELSSLPNLYSLIKKCLCYPHGVVYMAGKKHYFGVGGGTRQFQLFVEEDGVMDACLIAEVADGSSNVREVWKFSFK
ncbi:Protein-histidine N-methyltransferase protein [Dioscorea alata]|uniref:Protein-histidine N-methyltransferase protein n=1 Tax=Dioscorea alata TaxID=55571 RepID=A0ACB7TVI6_DIOAL|nr:Protein-histidine N-methyltransferase protein [Dioscorea alata]